MSLEEECVKAKCGRGFTAGTLLQIVVAMLLVITVFSFRCLGQEVVAMEEPPLMIPKALADYKLLEYWGMKGGQALLKGKEIIVGGLLSATLKSTQKGSRLDLAHGKVLCLPTDPGDSDFADITKFHEALLRYQENAADAYLDGLVKVIVKGEVSGRQPKPGTVELLNCTVLAWYGVEARLGRPKNSLRGLLPLKIISRDVEHYIEPSGDRTLCFRIVAGRITPNEKVPLFLSSKSELISVVGPVYRSRGEVQGLKFDIEGKVSVVMDSDPLCYGAEADEIHQILRRKRFPNVLELTMKGEASGKDNKILVNGVIESWKSLSPQVGLYTPPTLLGDTIALSPSVAIIQKDAPQDAVKEPAISLAQEETKTNSSPKNPEVKTPDSADKGKAERDARAAQSINEKRDSSDPNAQVQRPQNGVVIWNTHNWGYGGRGAEELLVSFYDGEKLVREETVTIPWNKQANPCIQLETGELMFDLLRVDVAKAHGISAGLAEVEVFRNGKNIARKAKVSGSDYNKRLCFPANAIDGITEDSGDGQGYWLSAKTTGYLELKLPK